jgi:hypothetical protein
MVCRIPVPPPHVALRIGEVLVPAIPIFLTGEAASLVLAWGIQDTLPVRLVLRWEDGSETDLAAEVVGLERGGRIAHLRVLTVAGDWRPFADYLGSRLGEIDDAVAAGSMTQ